jgi:hypothetical protein
MNVTTTIIGLFFLALFIVPIFIFSRQGKNKGKKYEKDFFSEVSINNLRISDKDFWKEHAIGIDTDQNKIIYIDWSGSEKVSYIFSLKDIKVFEPVPGFSEQHKRNFNLTKAPRLGLRFVFLESARAEINVTFHIAGLAQLNDEEIRLFKKWQSLISKKLDNRPVNDIKHTA